LESLGVRSSHSMSSMVAKRGPLRSIFRLGNSQKTLGARSGEYDGWVMEFGRRIPFDVFHGCETRPLEAHFQTREQPKVTRSEIRRVRWMGDDRSAFLGEELLHNKRCVARCIRTEPRIACCAAILRREKHSCHHPSTVLSGSRSE